MSARQERKRRLLGLEYDIRDSLMRSDDCRNCGYFSDDETTDLAEIYTLLKQIDAKLKRLKGD
ncbi:MAG: hypothetical protein IJP89_02550 [Synergistaceae bacterium]|nr:hypothetical protein [Synergistaceae bacterium]